MLSVTGIYDGKNIYPAEAIREQRKYKVIITFIEELDNENAEEPGVRNFGTNNASLAFWNNPEEDIYQDFLTKTASVRLHLNEHRNNCSYPVPICRTYEY
jgi:hypothetical protein